MNMKKSLAGVMAGAMAVSAMATVVSADQDAISLTYDLKTYVENNNDTKAKVTVIANYEGSLVSEKSVKLGFIGFGANNGFVTGETIYNSNGVKLGDGTSGAMTDFEFTARPYADIHDANKILEEKYQTFKATNDANNVDGAYYDTSLGGSAYTMDIYTGTGNTYGKFDLTKYDMKALGYSTEEAAASIGYKNQTNGFSAGTYGVRDAVAKMTYKIDNVVNLNTADGWGWNSDLDVEKLEKIYKEFFGSSVLGEVTMSAENFAKGFWTVDNGTVYKKSVVTGVTLTEDVDNTSGHGNGLASWNWTSDDGKYHNYYSGVDLVSAPTTVAVGSFTAGAKKEAVYPFKTTLKPETSADKSNYVAKTGNAENDVIDALTSRKTGGNKYTKPVAVLNDAIANHDNVVFTFTSYNGYVGTTKSHIAHQWVEVDRGYDYETSGGNDWHNPTFGQHLYTNLSDAYSLFDSNEYDQYGSYSSAWGINLFTGAIVVNSHLTMQLSDTDTFNWGSNTLSFDWFDITDEGKITDAKTFLTDMLLYTPTDWYWDTLTVVVSDDEDENIDAGEGLDGEGDTIDDEEPAEDVVEEPTEDVVEEPAETDAAPVETAPSPATGNAPVALAVIPVALAAAAVVAKKRG